MKDTGAMKRKVLANPKCRVCDKPSCSAHHFLPRSLGGDDVDDALIELCGDGTRGCHGKAESADPETRRIIGERFRPEELRYAIRRLGEGRAAAFLHRYYYVEEDRVAA